MSIPPTFTLREAIIKAENYCAYQERCHKEVRQKLYEMRLGIENIDRVIVHLIENNFLNEQRFAESYVRGKFRIKKWGRRRIISELKFKDISKYNIDYAIAAISEDEYISTFNDLATKKLKSLNSLPIQKKKRKLADYLLYRGWESHLVYDKINELINK